MTTPKPITKFDKAECARLGAALLPAVEAVAKSLGLAARTAGGTYDVSGGKFTLKIEFKVGGAGGADGDRLMFNEYAARYGLTPEDFGRTLRLNGREGKIVGIAPSRGKRPIIVEHAGKRFVYADEDIRRVLGRQYDWEKDPGVLVETPAPRQR